MKQQRVGNNLRKIKRTVITTDFLQRYFSSSAFSSSHFHIFPSIKTTGANVLLSFLLEQKKKGSVSLAVALHPVGEEERERSPGLLTAAWLEAFKIILFANENEAFSNLHSPSPAAIDVLRALSESSTSRRDSCFLHN